MISEARFEPDPTSVRRARRLVEEALDGLPPDVCDAAVLITSELATNCVVHASTAFEIRVDRRDDVVCILVSDGGSGQPVLRWPDVNDQHGRGLQVVQMLSDRWGTVPAADDGAKTVWFELALGEGASSAHPRRSERTEPRSGWSIAPGSPAAG